MEICGIYRITNTITGDFYIGRSKDVKRKWAQHKCFSEWRKQPNNPMYLDMKKHGVDKFVFEILAEAEPDKLKETEQQFMEKLQPSYNNRNANGRDFERKKEYQKEYQKTDKYKEYMKEYTKEYYKSDKGKESLKKAQNKYQNQLCLYNGETLTLGALAKRFNRKGIPHPNVEAKKYLI